MSDGQFIILYGLNILTLLRANPKGMLSEVLHDKVIIELCNQLHITLSANEYYQHRTMVTHAELTLLDSGLIDYFDDRVMLVRGD